MVGVMSDPKFVEFPLDQFHQRRILYAVNKDFLWPLGLALSVTFEEDGSYSKLDVRQWEWADGHREAIEDSEPEYDAEFGRWLAERRAEMPEADRAILEARHGS
jgi:hypothetical protein